MNFKKFDLKNNAFTRKSPTYRELKKERILIGSGNSSTYKKEATRKANIASKYFIPITYTHIYTKKLGQVGHFLINLFSGAAAGSFWSTSSSPSINWSAFGQTLFQRACFIGELFEKGKEFEVNGLEVPGTGVQKR